MRKVNPENVARWMLAEIEDHGCIYQDDVVDFLVREKADLFLRENADGNLAIGQEVLRAFMAITKETVVWVKPDRYWRLRVPEDEPGREAQG